MKGVMGLSDFLMVNFQPTELNGSMKGINGDNSFNNYLNKFVKGNGKITSTKEGVKEEENLLKRVLEFLTHLKKLLSTEEMKKVKELSNFDLQQIIGQMFGDLTFIASLPEHLKGLLQKLKTEDILTLDLKENIKAKNELITAWLNHQRQQQQKLIEDIEKVISSIEYKLFKNGSEKNKIIYGGKLPLDKGKLENENFVARKEQLQTDELSIKFNKDRAKTDIELRKVLAEPTVKKEDSVKTIFERVSSLLTRAENTVANSGVMDSLKDLKNDLQRYLNKNNYYKLYRDDFSAKYSTLINLSGDEADSSLQKSELAKNLIAETDKNLTLIRKEGEMVEDEQNLDLSFNVNLRHSKNDGIQNQNGVKREEIFYRQNQAEQIINQMIEAFKIDLKKGITNLEMKLYPEELGRLLLKLTLQDGVMTARILAETRQVKDLIEQNLPHLKESLEEEGIYWDKVTVDVGHDELAENPHTYHNHREANKDSHNGSSFNGEFDLNLAKEDVITEEISKSVKDPDRLVDYLA